MVSILTVPKNALVKQYQRMFEIDGVELVFDDEAIKAIAEQALSRGTGARGLRAILEEVLQQTMFEVPGMDDVARVVVTREVVVDRVTPAFIAKVRDVDGDKSVTTSGRARPALASAADDEDEGAA
jgi:ATP-dependent Clp protease ATP-binding subunit ClpX